MTTHPDIPTELLTRDQVRRVDRLAIEELGIPGVVLMENAGRNAASVILEFLQDQLGRDPSSSRVAVICGGGNNGGDGYVIARHLHNARVDVTIYTTTDPTTLTGDAATHYAVCAKMGLPIHPTLTAASRTGRSSVVARPQDLTGYDMLVDALLGTGFRGQVRTPIAKVIELINQARAAKQGGDPSVVAVDVPSGLDCDTGQPSNATVRADLTVTFIACKTGFTTSVAKSYTGRVLVADIGAPPELIARVVHDQSSG